MVSYHLRERRSKVQVFKGHQENFNEHFKGIFGGHGQVPTKGRCNTRRFALGAIFVYQLALLYRFQNGLDLNVGLKAFLKAA